MKFKELEPLVYKVVKKAESSTYDLVITGDRYRVEKKSYGIINRLVPRIKHLISKELFGEISLIATGGKGLGKTTAINKLANLLLEAKIPVIEVKFLEVNSSLIEFLSSFRNVCIYIDEFAKVFPYKEQENMLTLLNEQIGYFNIYLLAENCERDVSTYIIDRMERIKYRLHYSRIPTEDLIEYCNDNEMSENIRDSLIAINKVSSTISYDTLKNILKEHREFPDLSFSELTEVLNVRGILGTPVIAIVDVQAISETRYVKSFKQYGTPNIKLTDFLNGWGFSLDIVTDLIDVDVKDAEEVKTPQPFPVHQSPQSTIRTDNVRVSKDLLYHVDDVNSLYEIRAKENGLEYKIIIGVNMSHNTSSTWY